MLKSFQLDVEDSNVAGIGSDEDKEARKAAAETEEAWAGVGEEPGLRVWRIEKFQVVAQPEEDRGTFYDGDSYIVLHTTVDPEGETKLLFDIYFWLGLDSSQDERGTAAYKTVELDDLLDGAAVQHREVMLHESDGFKHLWGAHIDYLKGGVDTGFNKVEDKAEYPARLLQVKKTGRRTQTIEVACSRDSLTHADAYVLDAGAQIYMWSGDEASPFEKSAARMAAEKMESSRSGESTVTDDLDDAFWAALGGEGDIKSAEEAEAVLPEPVPVGEGVLYKLSDSSGELEVEEVGRGDLSPEMLSAEDVFICDPGPEVLVLVGEAASDRERRNAMHTTTRYMHMQDKPHTTPVKVFKSQAAAMRDPLWAKIFAA